MMNPGAGGPHLDPVPTPALIGFRREFHNCLFSWADALFELCDAVLCAPAPVGSVPSLSLEPVFRRSHGSLYKALAQGSLDTDMVRRALVAYRPVHWPPVFAVDASTWDRCDAETSPERGFYYSATKHSAGQPIVAGWSYQWITQLDWAPDSWTAPLDAQRIAPTADATTATIDQVQRLVGLLNADSDVPMFVFDAGYDPIALGAGLAATRTQVLVRISSKRVFHPDPAPRPEGTLGRPRRHGDRFVLSEPTTWPDPDAELVTHDSRYGDVRVKAWSGLHPKLHGRGRWAGADAPPIVRGTAIRVEVEHLPKPTTRAVKTLCGCGGPDPANPTSTSAGGPTYDASTSNTPSGSRKAHSAGPPPRYAHPNKRTAGPGSSSPPTPNSD
jgi:DDE superfamily endonuclease